MLSEGNQTILLSILPDSGYSLASPTTAAGTIRDDDIDLRVTTTESTDPVVPGSGPGNLVYTVTIRNVGLTNATGIVLGEIFSIPPGVSVTSVGVTAGSRTQDSATHYTWNLGNLAAGASATLTATLTVGSAAAVGTNVISNTAQVTAANENRTNTTDDTATVSTSIDDRIDLVVTQTMPATAREGDTITYNFTIRNNGPNTAANVVLTDMLPALVSFLNATFSQGGGANHFAGVVAINLGSLAPGATASAAITVRANENGAALNRVTVAGDPPEKTPANNSAAGSTAIANTPPTATLRGAASVAPGATYTLSLTETDPGNDTVARWTINWGDGTVQTILGNPRSVTHVFVNLPRPMTIRAVARDEDGQFAAANSVVVNIGFTPNQRFVAKVFLDLFRRPVDLASLQTWAAKIAAGVTHLQVVVALQTHPRNEFRSVQVQDLYQKYLRRAADPVGLSRGIAHLVRGGTVEQYAAILLGSTEYLRTRTNGTQISFLDAVFRDVLGRPLDLTSRTTYTRLLASGVSRANVALRILHSREARERLVRDFYLRFLNRPADPVGLANHVRSRLAGMRVEQLMAIFMSSAAYRR